MMGSVPPFPQEPQARTLPDYRNAMDRLSAIAVDMANSSAKMPLTPAQRAVIQERFAHYFKGFRTPDHPPYSAMITRAIGELKEKTGSSMESISRFLKKVYKDLPLAHQTLLEHHLCNLCESGEIVIADNKRYLLPDEISNASSCPRLKRKKLKRKRLLQLKRQTKRGKINATERENKHEERVIEGSGGEEDKEDELENEVPDDEVVCQKSDHVNGDSDLFGRDIQLKLSSSEGSATIDSMLVDGSLPSGSKPSIDVGANIVQPGSLANACMSSQSQDTPGTEMLEQVQNKNFEEPVCYHQRGRSVRQIPDVKWQPSNTYCGNLSRKQFDERSWRREKDLAMNKEGFSTSRLTHDHPLVQQKQLVEVGKRGRGRPPKSYSYANTSSSIKRQQVKVIKKRGRPRKEDLRE